MKMIKQLVFALFVGSFALVVSGCSVIGFGIGNASDSNNKISWQEFSGEELTQMPKNSEIQIFLKNGQVQKGRFIRLLEQQEGEETINSIVWNDLATYRQAATQITEIERVVIKSTEGNNKWLGLSVGGLLDAISVFYLINNVDFGLYQGS